MKLVRNNLNDTSHHVRLAFKFTVTIIYFLHGTKMPKF
jgi:hypothetical protein